MPKDVYFMGSKVRISDQVEIVAAINSGATMRIATLNPEFMLEAEKNQSFRVALGQMTHCTVDGFGLYLALGRRFARYTGADLVNDLAIRYADGSKRFFLLGGLGDEAILAAAELRRRFPGLTVVGAESGGAIADPNHPDSDLVARIKALQPDILLVGFGAPKQELWIANAGGVATVMVGIGGSFGFYSTKQRAPGLFRRTGTEWLWRGLTEPGHWRRIWHAVVIFPLHAVTSNPKQHHGA
jgi:N-acetylglucosaminyldiphosphoundecaprenol N-acetyl-beta-D-mannosaminyltransferase